LSVAAALCVAAMYEVPMVPTLPVDQDCAAAHSMVS